MIFPFLNERGVEHHDVFNEPAPPRYWIVREFEESAPPSFVLHTSPLYIAERLPIYIERTYRLRVVRGNPETYTPPRLFYAPV